MNTMNRWLVNSACNQNSLEVVTHAKLLRNSGTCLLQLMNASGFHQNVGELAQVDVYNVPRPSFLSKAFSKGSGRARHQWYIFISMTGIIFIIEKKKKMMQL